MDYCLNFTTHIVQNILKYQMCKQLFLLIQMLIIDFFFFYFLFHFI